MSQANNPRLIPAREGGMTVPAQAIREIFGVVGAGVAGYGAWLHYQPLGFMVGGGIMVALAIVGTLRGNA